MMKISKTILDNMTTNERMEYLMKDYVPSLREPFEKFDKENPHVFATLDEWSVKDYSKDRTYGSISRWFEELRTTPLAVRGSGKYVLSNNLRAGYARKLISRHPEFVGWIELTILTGQSYKQYE